ncbi:HNH endonuclease [Paracoccus liaowanqingii]|uniref:HNH endonuclease n=1 Tax=Paracoccus liaowanqingii TaxID=2560053 RepID=A0A4Z1CS82_9RHOB|nr:HNH endonuclease signature motif containing protein [Paracoccus liaowanqingii]TGN68270.1 HNH endonuclease [Paracoccus liaowanqingii]
MARPPRLCACGQIVPAGQLCTCQVMAMRARKRRHDQNRPSSLQRGYNGEWRKLRAEFLRHHPFCAFCGVEAKHVDHKVRHQGDKALLLSWANLQSLCAHCHNSVKQRAERMQAQSNNK